MKVAPFFITVLEMYITKTTNQRWARILNGTKSNLIFSESSNLKFSLLKQYKWILRTWSASGQWCLHFIFENGKLTMPIWRDWKSENLPQNWKSCFELELTSRCFNDLVSFLEPPGSYSNNYFELEVYESCWRSPSASFWFWLWRMKEIVLLNCNRCWDDLYFR